MASGSIQKEKPTDQQCTHCGLWYDSRGIDTHEENCDGSRPDDQADQVETFDPQADQEPTDPGGPDETDTETMTETCPNCGNDDDVVETIDYAKQLNAQGELTQSKLEQLKAHDHACENCEVVWDG